MNTPPKKTTPNTTIASHKSAWQNASSRRPVAPPVYRPQAVPRVLQTKRPLGQSSHPKTMPQQRKSTTPPPVYRPEQKFVQAKIASGAKPHTPPKVPPRAVSSKLPIQAKQMHSVQTRSASPITARMRNQPSIHQPVLQTKMPSAASPLRKPPITISRRGGPGRQIIQRKVGFEFELGYIKTQKDTSYLPFSSSWQRHSRGEVILHRPGYDITADVGDDGGSQIEFVLREIDENSIAGKNSIVNAATNVVADIRKLCRSTGQWVAGEQMWGDSPRGHRFQALWEFDKQVGQLQMTGGIDIERIGHIVSGQAGEGMKAAEFLGNYRLGNTQPVWKSALAAVKRNFSALRLEHQEVLAGVVAMIAQVPLSMHDEAASMAGQGMFTAKTDYSKILAETVRYIGSLLPPNAFVQTVMETINSTIAGGLNPEKRILESAGVFPDDYRVNGVRLGGVLKIDRWLRDMLPSYGPQGIDLLTPDHFPGDASQRREMRAFGRFGSRTDPGNRPIVEWRNISACYPDNLPKLVGDLVDYLRMANTPRLIEFPRAVGE